MWIRMALSIEVAIWIPTPLAGACVKSDGVRWVALRQCCGPDGTDACATGTRVDIER